MRGMPGSPRRIKPSGKRCPGKGTLPTMKAGHLTASLFSTAVPADHPPIDIFGAGFAAPLSSLAITFSAIAI